MDWAANLDAAAFGALVAAASGVLVPRIIERVPEPEPEEPDEADRADESGAAPGADGQAPRFEGASQPDEEPKELYAAIAARPGLLWKCVLAAAVRGGLIGWAVGWDWSLLFLLPLVPVWRRAGRHRLAHPAAADLADRAARTSCVVVLVLVAALRSRRTGTTWSAPGIGWVGAGRLFFVLWFVYPRGLGLRRRPAVRAPRPRARLARLAAELRRRASTPGSCSAASAVALLSLLRIVDRKGFPFGPFMLVGALVGPAGRRLAVAGLVTGAERDPGRCAAA